MFFFFFPSFVFFQDVFKQSMGYLSSTTKGMYVRFCKLQKQPRFQMFPSQLKNEKLTFYVKKKTNLLYIVCWSYYMCNTNN